MSTKNLKAASGGPSTAASTIDAASINHESAKGRTQFYQAVLELLYLKVDALQFDKPIPENYQRQRTKLNEYRKK